MEEKRKSNIELYRIIVMLLIIAHHYVVNSGLGSLIDANPGKVQSIYLLALGAWGKTGINCFILITGYFMCKQHITITKWLNLLFEIVFYNIVVYLGFMVCDYEVFSWKRVFEVLVPVNNISTSFTGCFLVLYLFVPFLNILINNLNERQYTRLLILCIGAFTILGSLPYITISMNYVWWFMVIYLVGAYIRLYPKRIYSNYKIWGVITLCFVLIALASIYIVIRLGYPGYILLADSNKLFAVAIAISSFICFANLPIRYCKFINVVGKSTFGVLLIHANSDAMRMWLWRDVLKNVEMFDTPYIYIHSILSVLGVFVVCSIIDVIREKIFSKIGSLKLFQNGLRCLRR